jgi:hypothetical protein
VKVTIIFHETSKGVVPVKLYGYKDCWVAESAYFPGIYKIALTKEEAYEQWIAKLSKILRNVREEKAHDKWLANMSKILQHGDDPVERK